MPYKDPQKRREAYNRWAKKNVEKRKVYQRILWKAKRANPGIQKCSVDGCQNDGEKHHPDYSKPTEIIWICRYHHRRIKHAGKCKICGAKCVARGYCNKHYKSERKKIDPEYARLEKVRRERARKRNKPCPQS